MAIKDLYREFKNVLKMAGVPGWLLMGYNVVQIVFARQKSDYAAVDGSALVFAAYALGSGIYCLRNLRKDAFARTFYSFLMKKTCIRWFMVYTIICAISALWSPNIALSGYRALECMGMLFLNAAVMKNLIRNVNEEGIMLWSVSYAFVTTMLQILAHLSDNIYITLYSVQFPSTIFFYLVFYYAPKRMMRWPMLVIALACRSTTGYIGMAMGMCSLLYSKKYRFLGVGLIAIIISLTCIVGGDTFLNNTVFASKGGVIQNGQFQNDEEATSGRTLIWRKAIEGMVNNGKEWYGEGFVAGETLFVQNVIGNQVIGMHNGFLSAFVGTGYIGLFFFILFMLEYTMAVFNKKIPRQYKIVLIAIFFCVFIHTLGNPGLGFRVYGTWMPSMFVIMLTCGLYIKYNYMKKINPHYTIYVDRRKRMYVKEM